MENKQKLMALALFTILAAGMYYSLTPPKKNWTQNLCDHLPLVYSLFLAAVGVSMLLIAIKWH